MSNTNESMDEIHHLDTTMDQNLPNQPNDKHDDDTTYHPYRIEVEGQDTLSQQVQKNHHTTSNNPLVSNDTVYNNSNQDSTQPLTINHLPPQSTHLHALQLTHAPKHNRSASTITTTAIPMSYHIHHSSTNRTATASSTLTTSSTSTDQRHDSISYNRNASINPNNKSHLTTPATHKKHVSEVINWKPYISTQANRQVDVIQPVIESHVMNQQQGSEKVSGGGRAEKSHSVIRTSTVWAGGHNGRENSLSKHRQNTTSTTTAHKYMTSSNDQPHHDHTKHAPLSSSAPHHPHARTQSFSSIHTLPSHHQKPVNYEKSHPPTSTPHLPHNDKSPKMYPSPIKRSLPATTGVSEHDLLRATTSFNVSEKNLLNNQHHNSDVLSPAQLLYLRYKGRYHRYRRRISLYMSTRIYMCIGVFCTLLSLFAKDFTLAFLPPTCDTPTSILLCVIFTLFSIEVLLSCIVRKHYILSFYFFLDIIGTWSILLDISFIVDLFWNLDTQNSMNSNSQGQLSRSTNLLQVTKFSRILRILRLIRIVRIFKFHHSFNQSRYVSKVGLYLSELIDKRIIFMLLGLLIIVPFFTITVPDDVSPLLGLNVLDQVKNSQQRSVIVNEYLSAQSACYYLYIATNPTTVYKDLSNESSYKGLRVNEKFTYTTATGSIAIYSTRSTVFDDSLYNMGITVLVILLFLGGTILISKEIEKLVVAPLTRMSHMIKKLAGTICIMNGDEEHDVMKKDGSDGNNEKNENDRHVSLSYENSMKKSSSLATAETNMLEAVIEKMALIFAVQPDLSSHNVNGKALSMMTGTKHTEIRTNNSVVSIEVVERPRERTFNEILSMDDMEDDEMSDMNQSMTGTTTENSFNSSNQENSVSRKSKSATTTTPTKTNAKIVVDIHTYPELRSIESIIATPLALDYFKMYMAANLMIENILFHDEVSRFKTIMTVHTQHIWNYFISSSRANNHAINIPATMRDQIHTALLRDDTRSSVFDEAQHEVYQLMNQGHLRTFIQSKYAQAYVAMRYDQLLVRGVIDAEGNLVKRNHTFTSIHDAGK